MPKRRWNFFSFSGCATWTGIRSAFEQGVIPRKRMRGNFDEDEQELKLIFSKTETRIFFSFSRHVLDCAKNSFGCKIEYHENDRVAENVNESARE